MRTTAVSLGILLFAVAAIPSGASFRGQPAKVAAPRLPEDAKWLLHRDFKIDGKLEDAQETRLHLKGKGNQLSGYYVDKKALGVVNETAYTLEVVTREKPLLILRGEHKDTESTYVIIHAGHLVGENHYRGTWHDNAGNAGDFELKVSK